MRTRVHVWILLLCVFALPALAQKTSQPHIGDTNPPTDEDEARSHISAEMAKRAAKERAATIKADTDKLLKLSVELKQYVDKADENVLSLDVIKKAEEIEKLAHSVREKMKGPN